MPDSVTTAAQPAGLLPRLGAALYDGLLLLALLFATTALIDPFMPDDHVPAGAWWFRLLLLIVAFLFCGWFWTHGGQTLGMRAWRLRVTREDGNPLNWQAAALRFTLAIPSWLTVLGVLCCVIDGRTLHDRFSRSRVLRIPRSS